MTEQPNFIILMTDQQRSIQHFPDEWVKKNLPNYQFFLENGVNFENNICNTSPCGPSRASLFSGMYPASNGITDNFGTVSPEDMNFANILNEMGYDIYYKGKLHMNDKITLFSQSWTEEYNKAPALAKKEDEYLKALYGMKNWTSPDFGTSLVQENPTNAEIATMAGGSGHNDSRVVTGEYRTYADQESVLDFLSAVQKNKPKRPFCLVVSLLNPHDVSLYPSGWEAAGYQNALFEHHSSLELPASYSDTLETKPHTQAAYLNADLKGRLEKPDAENYVKFYAYLHTLSDALHGLVLDAIGDDLLKDSIIIRMADHGEMGMAHGGLQEKTFNAYNETIKVPLIWYSPSRFTAGKRKQLVSHIDLVPTLASIAGANPNNYPKLQGVNYSEAIRDESYNPQAAVLFNYNFKSKTETSDDSADQNQSTDTSEAPNPCTSPTHKPEYILNPSVPAGATPDDYPSNIYAIVTAEWKYAVYYDLDDEGKVDWTTAEFELYDQSNDAAELINLLPVGSAKHSRRSRVKQHELHAELSALLVQNGIQVPGWTDEPRW